MAPLLSQYCFVAIGCLHCSNVKPWEVWSRLPSSLWKLRLHVCTMWPLCEETFPTSIPREACKGAGINNSRARWTQVPSFSSPSYMGLMDTGIIPPERRRLFWTRLQWPNALCTPSKKTQVCILDEIKPLRTKAVQCWCSLLRGKMKETNNISHRAAITATLKWKSQRGAWCEVKACFCYFLRFSLRGC